MTKWVCWMLAPAFALGGCAAQQTLVEYKPGHPASVGCTVQDELAGLYDDSGRIESTTVQAGQPIGFAKFGHHLVAIDGAQQIPLAEGHYAWRVEQAGRHCQSRPLQDRPTMTGPGVLFLGVLVAALDAFYRSCCS